MAINAILDVKSYMTWHTTLAKQRITNPRYKAIT